jgi:hypothetical protein
LEYKVIPIYLVPCGYCFILVSPVVVTLNVGDVEKSVPEESEDGKSEGQLLQGSQSEEAPGGSTDSSGGGAKGSEVQSEPGEFVVKVFGKNEAPLGDSLEEEHDIELVDGSADVEGLPPMEGSGHAGHHKKKPGKSRRKVG